MAGIHQKDDSHKYIGAEIGIFLLSRSVIRMIFLYKFNNPIEVSKCLLLQQNIWFQQFINVNYFNDTFIYSFFH